MLKVINYNYHRTNPNIDIHKKDGSLRVYIINKKEYYLFGVLMYTTILYDRCCSIVSNGLALGAVADFGAQNCQNTTKIDAR